MSSTSPGFHPRHVALAEQLRRQLDDRVVDPDAPEARLSVDRYTSAERLELERRHVFAANPIIVAHSSQLARPGDCIADDSTGVSVVVVRGADGVVRGFLNACRHRATQLVSGPPCRRKAFVCPYHGWTYHLDGRLAHVPHAEAFTAVEGDSHDLVPVSVQERHGFVWLTARAEPPAIADYLGEIDDELSALRVAEHIPYASYSCERSANWKLVIDAFLEGYHIRTLHRGSIYPFFLDARTISQREGPHIRGVAARRELKAATPADVGERVRELATPSYIVFPNTVFIAHPDYISRMTVYPLAPDRLRWVHTILIPSPPQSPAERGHWERSAELIENTVFQKEDLEIAERMHRGIASGANDALTIGKLETAISWFHASIDAALG